MPTRPTGAEEILEDPPTPIDPDFVAYKRHFRTSADLFCIADTEGWFRHLSPQWATVLRRPLREIASVPFINWVHPDDEGATVEAMARLGQGDRVTLFDNRYLRSDGSWVPLRWNSTLDARRQLIYATARDMTKQHALEQARIRLFRLAGHELASPVTALRYRLAAIEPDTKIPPSELRGLLASVDRISRLVKDAQAAAGLEGEELEIHRQPGVDVAELASAVFLELTDSAMARGQQLIIDEGSCIIEADAHRISQVIYNLTWNALKFNRRGGTVRFKCGQSPHAWFSVQDQGRGLRSSEIERLFQAYSQVHEAGAVDERGTGLGLFICRRIVEAHGGSITVTSAGPDRGSCFLVTLP